MVKAKATGKSKSREQQEPVVVPEKRACEVLPNPKGPFWVTLHYDSSVTYYCDPNAKLSTGDMVMLMAQGRACDVGRITTKSFPECKEFRIEFLNDPAKRGSITRMLFETENLTANGSWSDGDWLIARVMKISQAL